MRVLLLTKVGEKEDEGMKNFGINLEKELNKRKDFEVKKFDTNKPVSKKNISKLANFSPDIVHLIPGPTSRGLAFLHFLSSVTRSKSVATCIHPDIRFLPRIIAPDLMYVQTNDYEDYFNSMCETKFLPSGVDTDEFTPDSEGVDEIREQFGLTDRPVFLHVGHVKSGRGVEDLTTLTEFGDILVIGSPSTNPDDEVIDYLETNGCTVSTNYIPDIAKIYNSSDIYVFPTVDEAHSIQFPLSILEAMACNLPVLSTPFGTLPEYFEEGEGLEFIQDFSSVDENTIREIQKDVQNRSRVTNLSWENVIDGIIEDYKRI